MKKQIKKAIRYFIQQYHGLKPNNTFTEVLNDPEGQDLFFLTGYDKSGTTWIKQAINDVKHFSCIGSNQYFDYLKATPESQILHTIANSKDKKSVFNISASDYELFFKASYVNKIKTFSKEETRYFGEKSTVQDVNLIHRIFPKSKTIVLIRDPRDIIVSFAFHFDRRNKKQTEVWSQEKSKFEADGTIKQTFIDREVPKILDYYNHLLQAKQAFPDSVIFVAYEDLISDAGFNVFLKLLKFIDADAFTIENAQWAWNQNTFEKLSAGRKPGDKDASSFFRSGTAKDYLNHLSEAQVLKLNELLINPLKQFNYLK